LRAQVAGLARLGNTWGVVEAVAGSVVEMWAAMVRGIPGSWTRRVGGALGTWAGVPVATMNGVLVAGESDEVVVEDLLAEAAAGGLPYSIAGRPAFAGRLEAVAGTRGMVARPGVPLMALADLRAVREVPLAGVERLAAGEASVHSDVAAAGFAMPREIFGRLEGIMSLDGVCAYVVRVDGQAVASALCCVRDGYAGIFNVATLERYRRRGLGAAVTARAALDAFDAGARCAWLQSSPLGRGIYERLGFELLEEWPVWVSA